jgi:hypothetical protein
MAEPEKRPEQSGYICPKCKAAMRSPATLRVHMDDRYCLERQAQNSRG